MFRALCAHHQEVKVILYSIWYHHTCRWPSGAQVERRVLSQPVHRSREESSLSLCTGREKSPLSACTQVERRVLSQPVHRSREESSLSLYTGREKSPLSTCAPDGHLQCDDTRCCIIQFSPPDEEYIVLETCKAYDKLTIKQDFVH